MGATGLAAVQTVAAAGLPACVVDARLALSRLGLHAMTRMTTQFQVWIPRELREILRDTGRHIEAPERLVPRVYCAALRNIDPAAEAEEVRGELAHWSRLPDNDDLAAVAIHYLGDRADECSLPPDVDRGLRERSVSLQRGLDLLMQRSGYDLPRGRFVAACVRDGAALAAALHPYGAFILTRLESDGVEAPSLCTYLDAWGVGTMEIRSLGGRHTRPLREAVARCGLGPLEWSGVALAVAHVVVTGFPLIGDDGNDLEEEVVAGFWLGARVFWHRV